MPTKKQLAMIHVAKTRLGMTECEYRDMLESVGVKSSKDLTEGQFDSLMRHLEHMGFTLPAGGRYRRPAAEGSRGLLTKKVYALMTAMNLTRAYLDAMARRMFGVDSWIWCDAEQMRKLIAALNYHRQRHNNRKEVNGNGGR